MSQGPCHSHSHDATHGTDEAHHRSVRRLSLALVLTVGFVGFEVFYGIQSHSLALLSDALHNLTDALALLLSGWALRVAGRAAHDRKTFGYHRAGILAALFNSVSLIGIAAWIGWEAALRLENPETVDSETLLGVAGLALVINGLTAWLVGHGSHHDLNLRSAFLHLLGDVLSNLGAMAAGLGIYLTGASWLDPLASLLIAVLILWNAWLIVHETLEILMEGTPRDIAMDQLVSTLAIEEGVFGVHDLHVWSLSKSLRFLTAHLEVADMPLSETARLRRVLEERLAHRFGIHHVTLQMEATPACTRDLYCRLGRTGALDQSQTASPDPVPGPWSKAAQSGVKEEPHHQREDGRGDPPNEDDGRPGTEDFTPRLVAVDDDWPQKATGHQRGQEDGRESL